MENVQGREISSLVIARRHPRQHLNLSIDSIIPLLALPLPMHVQLPHSINLNIDSILPLLALPHPIHAQLPHTNLSIVLRRHLLRGHRHSSGRPIIIQLLLPNHPGHIQPVHRRLHIISDPQLHSPTSIPLHLEHIQRGTSITLGSRHQDHVLLLPLCLRRARQPRQPRLLCRI